MKKIFYLSIASLVLCGCTTIYNSSNVSSTSDNSSNDSSFVDTSSTQTSSQPTYETIFYKDFSGYVNEELEFFAEGYSTANSKFGDNYINLIDPDGYVRTCDIENLSNDIVINLKSHVTNLHNLNDTAVGQTFGFKIETINYHLDENDFSVIDVIDDYHFEYTLTPQDIVNQSIPNIPSYSADFSNDPISVSLNGKGANKILITMTSKIDFIIGDKTAGCNFSIHSLEVLKY